MIFGATLRGVDAHPVRVEKQLEPGLPTLIIKGLAVAAERESRVRVQAALANACVAIDKRVTVSCDAAGRAIDGTSLDLAIALAIAADTKVRVGAVGELSLAGDVRPVRGVLAAVEALRSMVDVVLVAPENAAEASLVEGATLVVVRTLSEALDELAGRKKAPRAALLSAPTKAPLSLDMRDVVGQERGRRALEVAAAGNHNLLLIGPPGAGKTMLARRLNGIMPPLTRAEALDVTRAHSAAGLNVGGGLIKARPFRAPHHSTTPPGLVGGGAAVPRPGEVTLAHHGVLFLDELPEFSRMTLEVLREPLATGEVVLARASGTLRFPSRCLVVASMSPCPCGRHPSPRCRCAAADIARYFARIPAALMELFDLRVTLEPVDLTQVDGAAAREDSAHVAARIAQARSRLAHRERDQQRERRVALTIAALAASDDIRSEHVAEARSLTTQVAR